MSFKMEGAIGGGNNRIQTDLFAFCQKAFGNKRQIKSRILILIDKFSYSHSAFILAKCEYG
jgi:hypothetical protein